MRVGLPRALLYHRYGRFWKSYLAGLGAEVVVSRPTDKQLVRTGVGLVPSEVCLPIKIAAGHIADLADKVDAVFLPRLMWLEDKLYACPKMIGIVDIARMMLGDHTRLIAPNVGGGFAAPHLAAGFAITRNPLRVARAYRRARPLLEGPRVAPCLPAGEKRVAVIGHFYNIEDEYVSRAIIDTFRGHGYRVVTKDELPEALLHSRAGFAQKIRWVYERHLYNAFRYYVDKVDGVCVIVSMGCGPDSLVAEFMHDEARALDVPFIQLVLDEHTGTAGLVTRIEAFVELAQRRGRRTA
jgi:predicted nucleotide-binding protein (sugar kinase/HSP70/actin superfamily)